MKALNVVPKGTEPNDEKALNEVQQQGAGLRSARSAKALTPATLDAVLTPPRRDRIIWTLGGIASRIGTGTDFVRDTLAKQPVSPVKEIGGRYYAFEEDLIEYLRSPPTGRRSP